MIRIFKKEGGYILAWVVCFFLVVSILSAIALSASITSTQTTKVQHSQQQVSYTAKSVAGSVAQYIIQNADNAQRIESMTNSQGKGSLPNMGDYTVDVSYISQSKMKIKVTATYQGQTDTVSAYLIRPPAPSGILPTDNVVYVNGDGTGFGQCKLNGSVYVDGNLNLSQGSSISDFIVVKGTTTMSGSGNTTKGLFSFGNVYLQNGSLVAGDLYSKGDLKMDGNADISGSAFVDGSLTMLNGSVRQDAVIGNNAHFAGGAKLHGSLLYGGKVTTAWGNVYSFVSGGATNITDYSPLDSSPYTAPALPVINVPTRAQMPELYNSVVISNKTISDSGTITPAVVSQINQMQWGTTLTIDATEKDINLLLDNTTFSLTNGVDIEVVSDGRHNVIIYMTGNSSISVNSNEYIGMQVMSSSPRLFIIGDGEQTISLNNNSELDACVYLPQGTINASGSPLETYKFVGSCIVKYANINSNVMFHYSKPDLDGTPLKIFDSGSYIPGEGAWIIESWDDK